MADNKVTVTRNQTTPFGTVVGVSSKDFGFTAKQGDKEATGKTPAEAVKNLVEKH